jgi:hypothetical protein
MKTITLRIAIMTGIFLFFTALSYSQVGINSASLPPDGSAMLDVSSTVKGMLAPRMTQAQRNGILNPAAGLMIFQTDGVAGLYYNSGTPYIPIWLLVGNNAGQWTNDPAGIHYNAGNVGLGMNSGIYRLMVDGFISNTNTSGFPFLNLDLNSAYLFGNAGIRINANGSPKAYLYYANADDMLMINSDAAGGYRPDLVIPSTGLVGIGTSTPQAQFHVAEKSPGYTALFGSQVGGWNTSTNVNIGDDNGPSVLYIGQNSINKGFLYWNYNAVTDNAYFNIGSYAGANPLVLQEAGGKVGIGITAPQALLHVTKNGANYTGLFGSPISSYSGGTNVSIGDNVADAVLYVGQDALHKGFFDWIYNATPANSYLTVGTFSGSNPLVLQVAGGNVGIGTISPISRLEIDYDNNGKIYAGFNAGNPLFMTHVQLPTNGDGQSGIFVYRDRSLANDGTGYGLNSTNTAVKGYSNWGDMYSFGTIGINYNDYTRCGGTLGADYNGIYWGALGYKSSGSVFYGGYFSSSGTGSGGGKSAQSSSGIGIGAWGDLMGADIHGKIYGLYAEGTDYAMFSNGPVYTNNLDVHLQESASGSNTVMYTSVSTDVTVQTSGVATLSAGKVDISFDPAFAAAVSSKSPVIVTVTPIGNSNGVYLASVSPSGFSVAENNHGKSNVTVNYIAIGKRAGYEHPDLPAEVTSVEYTRKLARGLHNDANTSTNGEGLYFQGEHLVVGTPPASQPSLAKPSMEKFMSQSSDRKTTDPATLSASVHPGGYQPVPANAPAATSKTSSPSTGTPVIMKFNYQKPGPEKRGVDAATPPR